MTEIPPVQQRRALILDDNDGNRMLLKFAMQVGKVDNVEARTATEALQVWQPYTFTFAFLDIELPDINLNGLEVARRIRKSDPKVAIIMCSTNDDPGIVAEAVNAGCDVFLTKPFQLDTLLNLVKDMDNVVLRATPQVMIVDNMARSRYAARPTMTLSAVQPADSSDAAPTESHECSSPTCAEVS